MWYEIEWCEANSLARTRREFIEADDLSDALVRMALMTELSDLGGSGHIMRVAGPPDPKFRK